MIIDRHLRNVALKDQVTKDFNGVYCFSLLVLFLFSVLLLLYRNMT